MGWSNSETVSRTMREGGKETGLMGIRFKFRGHKVLELYNGEGYTVI